MDKSKEYQLFARKLIDTIDKYLTYMNKDEEDKIALQMTANSFAKLAVILQDYVATLESLNAEKAESEVHI